MSASWLSRLERPTTYPELHTLYAEIAADVTTSSPRGALPDELEEAIRLIGRESVRDQSELDSFEDAYADFKEKESGVVGWIRRHLPFTETRRKDKAHRSEMRDQQAELLANLLVVARIRLLREGLLGERDRPLGAPVEIWEARIEKARSGDDPREWAERALALKEGIGYAQIFLDDVRRDVEGFADASFSADEERALQRQDLEDARSELGERLLEVERKQALVDEAASRLRETLHERLLGSRPAAREAAERIENMVGIEEAANAVREHLERLHEALEETHKHAGEVQDLQSLPAALVDDPAAEDAERARLLAARGEAESSVERAQADLDLANRRVGEARDLVSTLRAELRSLSEAGGMVEADPSAGFDDTAVRHAERALDEARRQVDAATSLNEAAVSAADEAKTSYEMLDRAAIERQQRQRDHEERRDQALAELRHADEEMQGLVDALDDVLEPYLRRSRRIMRLSSLPRLAKSLFPEHVHDAGRPGVADSPADALADALRRSEALRTEAAAELETLEEDLAQGRREQAERFRAFVHEALGARGAELVLADLAADSA